MLAEERQGIGFLQDPSAIAGDDAIFIGMAMPHARGVALPDSRAIGAQRERIGTLIPAVPVANDRYRRGIGRPDPKARPLLLQ